MTDTGFKFTKIRELEIKIQNWENGNHFEEQELSNLINQLIDFKQKAEKFICEEATKKGDFLFIVEDEIKGQSSDLIKVKKWCAETEKNKLMNCTIAQEINR